MSTLEAIPDTSPTTLTPDRGLGSVRGIHWLLAMGALVTTVSVYRLVAARWAHLPLAAQFLVLVAGSLAVFALGDLTRHRLRLPHAGSALLALFTVLIPVLSWGAGYLGLLEASLGVPAFLLGMGALLAAAVRVLQRVLRYRGWIFPAVLGLLAVVPPLVVHLAGGRPASFIPLVLLLGLAFRAGSRHVNRFLFHRDRLDGVDRPIHFLPFLVLGALFAAAAHAFGLTATHVALPLMLVAMVLVDTGEEYTRALRDATGRLPDRWPTRSVALLSLGFAAAVAAFPLSFRDPTQQTCALVSILGTWIFWNWSLRYSSVVAHVAGYVTVVFGYHFFPRLASELVRQLHAGFTDATGIAKRSPALWSFGHIGLLLGLIALALLMRRLKAPARLHRTHALLTTLHASAMVGISLLDRDAAFLFLPVGLALGLVGLRVTHRVELVLPCHAAVAAGTLVWSSVLLDAPGLLSGAALRALGLVTLGLLLAGRPLVAWLRRTSENRRVLPVFLVPPLVVALLTGLSDLMAMGVGAPWSGLLLLLAGASLLAAGHQTRSRLLFATGVLPVLLGAHGLPWGLEHDAADFMAPVTLTLFALCWLAQRASRHPSCSSWSWGAVLGLFQCGLIGLAWLFGAALGPVTLDVEPLILLLLGLWFVEDGLRSRGAQSLTLGLGLIATFVPFELWALGAIHSATEGLLWAGLVVAALLGLVHLKRGPWELLEGAARSLQLIWMALALVCALVVSGWWAVALAMLLTAQAVHHGRDRESGNLAGMALGLLALVQLSVAAMGATDGYLLGDLESLGLRLLPLLAALGLGWLLISDELRGRPDSPSLLLDLAVGVEGALAAGYVAAFFGPTPLSPAAHVVLIGVAVCFLARHFRRGLLTAHSRHTWLMQLWCGLAVLDGFTAGWLHVGHGQSPWVLLGAALVQYVLALAVQRGDLAHVFGPPCTFMAKALPALAGGISIYRALEGPAEVSIWLRVLPAFLASLFYLMMASQERNRWSSVLLSVCFLNLALPAVVSELAVLGPEFYFMAPGLALITLSGMLHQQMGAAWTRNIFAAGASFIYAMPIHALYSELGWAWQAVLAVFCVAFGAMSFALRSRALLTVSTAALLVDMGFFVLQIRATEPMLLWAGGTAFGMSLMAWAAWLEHKREGLLQQIRVFGHQFRAWS